MFREERRAGHEQIFWEHEGNRAVREGNWKLVSRFNNNSQWELYDLEADRTETSDLAARYPDRVKQMTGAWEAWARRAMVEDWDAVRTAPRQPIPGSLYPGDQKG